MCFATGKELEQYAAANHNISHQGREPRMNGEQISNFLVQIVRFCNKIYQYFTNWDDYVYIRLYSHPLITDISGDIYKSNWKIAIEQLILHVNFE